MAADDQSPDTAAPPNSLLGLRAEHVEMMREARRGDRSDDMLPRIRTFIDRIKAAGARIDSPADRDAAQDIITYWASALYTAGDEAALQAALPLLDPFDSANAPDLSTQPCPYRGLAAFGEDDAGRFFGREDDVKTIIDKLREAPVVLISGPSGSGKTSIVAAGVVPTLKSRLVDDDGNPVVLVVRPGADPFARLLRSIHDAAAGRALPDPGAWISEQKPRLERAPTHLRALLDATFPGRPVILVADDFEQLLATCPDAMTKEQFAEALTSVCADPQSPDRTIIIIDELYEPAALKLAPLAGNPVARFVLPPLTVPEVQCVIKGGAAAVGLKFDEGIVEDLAKDVAGDGRAPPTLQFTLGRLWNAREGNRITWDAYSKVGKPRDALRRAADAVFESLSSDEQQIARKLFLDLVQPANGGSFIRRRVRRDALAQIGPQDTVARIVAVYVEAGLIRQTAGVEFDDDRFDIPHDALATSWPRLRDWLQRERTDSVKKLQLVAMARRWQDAGFENSYLLSGAALEEAESYTAAAPELGLLVAKSRDEGRRARRRTFVRNAVISTIAALLVVAIWKWIEAAQEAEKERKLASGALSAITGVMRVIDNVDEGGGILPIPTTYRQLVIAQKILGSLSQRPNWETAPARINLLTELSWFSAWTENRAEALRYATSAEAAAEDYASKNSGDEEGERLLYESEWRVGDLLDKNREAAKSKYERALQIARKWASKKLEGDVWHQDLALMEYSMGDVVRTQNPDESLRRYKNGIALSQRGRIEKPNDRKWQRLDGWGHLLIGELYAQQNHPEQAHAEYRAMFQINESLVAAEPQNRLYQFNLSTDYLASGKLYQSESNFEQALTQYHKALELIGSLIKYDPEAPVWQEIGAHLHDLVAEINIRQHRFDDALKEYDIALQAQDRLAQRLPDEAERQRVLAVEYGHEGDAYKERGESRKDHNDLREAADAYKRGMVVIDKFKLRDPADASSLEQTSKDLQDKIQSLPPGLR
jgi:tetratricopeptide (TPR) repeat protein